MKKKPTKRVSGRIIERNGEYFVDGTARSAIHNAVQKLRAMPIDLKLLGPKLEAGALAVEKALASPSPMRIADYYRLLATVERTFAEGAQFMLDAEGATLLGADLLAMVLFARARARCLEAFSEAPLDDDGVRAMLLDGARLGGDRLARSIASPRQVLHPLEAAPIAAEMRFFAASTPRPVGDPLGDALRQMIERLEGSKPFPLSEFFELNESVQRGLLAFIGFALVKSPQPGEPDNLDTLAFGFANAAAASSFLVDVFEPGGAGGPARLLH